MPREYVWIQTGIPPKCKLSPWEKQRDGRVSPTEVFALVAPQEEIQSQLRRLIPEQKRLGDGFAAMLGHETLHEGRADGRVRDGAPKRVRFIFRQARSLFPQTAEHMMEPQQILNPFGWIGESAEIGRAHV